MAPSLDRIAAFFKRKKADTYEYLPLDEEASQIRLLTLRPGKFPAKIHVDLHTEQLTTEQRPRYEALSYAWGSTQDLVDIFVGPFTLYSVAVTQNLARALRYLRYPDRERVLWVDAICVNQKDLPERGHQVKQMANIYSMAKRVVVWLGEEGENSTIALQTLERLSTKVEVSYNHRTMKPASTQASESHWADRGVRLPFPELEWSAVCDLLGRPWFERLWVWQEIRLANQDAILTCGYDSIEWKTFRNAVFCFYMKLRTNDLGGFEHRVHRAFELCDCNGCFSFLALAEQTQLCKCTDVRDRVYALLSMVSDQEDLRIEPDYTKGFQEICEDLFVKDVEHSKSLRLLRSCELLNSTKGMQTWLTDWSIPRSAVRLRWSRASYSIRADVCFPREGILQVKGLQVATIHQVDVVRLQDGLGQNDIAKEVRRLASHFSVKDDRIEAFCRTICTNLFCENFHPPLEHLPNSQKSVTAFYEALTSQRDSRETFPEYLKYYSGIGVYLSGRSFFTTHDGHFGLAPLDTKENDLICILLGCNSAITLRATDNNQFQVVGEAYCQGFMTGEALLGPLPGSFDMIFRFEESSGSYFQAFIDRENGIIQAEDPRLGPLPPGWRIVDRADDPFGMWFVNDDNGSEPTRVDPRLTPKALRELGVDLRDFKLV
jgi:hypothetical protein